ncbi:MAG: GGDEF domain-containing protein [Carboxydocellales bacterium]
MPGIKPIVVIKKNVENLPEYWLIAVIGFLLPLFNDVYWQMQVDIFRFFYLIPALVAAYHKGLRGGLLSAILIIVLSGAVELSYNNAGINPTTFRVHLLGIVIFVLITVAGSWIMEKHIKRRRNLELINEELRLQALTDGLTGLYNFRYFYYRLDEEISRSKRLNTPLSLVMIDIDHFKSYNDTHGHPRGDSLLIDLGRLFQEHVRLVDTVARYGGEEFAIILADTGNEGALIAARRILEAVESHPFTGRSSQPEGRITVSIGISNYPTDAATKEELIEKADKALYYVKSRNKNNVQLYFDFDGLTH